jgi:hypothetical protein
VSSWIYTDLRITVWALCSSEGTFLYLSNLAILCLRSEVLCPRGSRSGSFLLQIFPAKLCRPSAHGDHLSFSVQRPVWYYLQSVIGSAHSTTSQNSIDGKKSIGVSNFVRLRQSLECKKVKCLFVVYIRNCQRPRLLRRMGGFLGINEWETIRKKTVVA